MTRVAAVTDADFSGAVLQADRPVLVDFWATWCTPCRMIAPIVEELSAELGDQVRFMKLDVDQNPQTSHAFGVMSIPTLIVFKDGRPADRVTGYRPGLKENLRDRLQALL